MLSPKQTESVLQTLRETRATPDLYIYKKAERKALIDLRRKVDNALASATVIPVSEKLRAC